MHSGLASGSSWEQAGAQPPMPIIVGSPRSGTTLLRFMLDAHPDLAIPPETGFLPGIAALDSGEESACEELLRRVTGTEETNSAWDDFALSAAEFERQVRSLRPFSPREAVRCFYRMYALRFGKSRWGDKTPLYCRSMPAIQELLPEATFIHLIRDGRDASLSLRSMWFAPSTDMADLARFWKDNVEAARRDSARCRRYLEVRYEDLVSDCAPVLRSICRFIDLPYHAAMETYFERTPDRLLEHRGRRDASGHFWLTSEQRLQQQWRTMHPPEAARSGVWRRGMPIEENRAFRREAGSLLEELGYPD